MEFDLRDTMSVFMDDKEERMSHLLGPSSVGKCYRQAAYEYLGVPEDRHVSKDKADLGTLLHLGWSALIRSMFDPAEREPDVRIKIPGLPRDGNADDVDWKHRIVTDLKSANARAWQRFIDRGGPYANYWDQAELYGWGLHLLVGGDWTLRLVVINSETGERTEFTKQADPARAAALAEIVDQRHAELTVATMIDGDPTALAETFPREGKGPGRGYPCDWCPFVGTCWPDPIGDLSPQAMTVVEDPAEVERIAGVYLEASQQEAAVKKAKYDAQAFLRGIEGTFGAYKIKTTGGKPTPDEPDPDAMVEALIELGQPIPMRPGAVRSSYPRVSRVKGA